MNMDCEIASSKAAAKVSLFPLNATCRFKYFDFHFANFLKNSFFLDTFVFLHLVAAGRRRSSRPTADPAGRLFLSLSVSQHFRCASIQYKRKIVSVWLTCTEY
jgi:hypothetical protein